MNVRDLPSIPEHLSQASSAQGSLSFKTVVCYCSEGFLGNYKQQDLLVPLKIAHSSPPLFLTSQHPVCLPDLVPLPRP